MIAGWRLDQVLLDEERRAIVDCRPPQRLARAAHKVLLGPDGLDANEVVRSGACMTSGIIIQLRTQQASQPAPTGWTLGSTSSGLNTYVKLTSVLWGRWQEMVHLFVNALGPACLP